MSRSRPRRTMRDQRCGSVPCRYPLVAAIAAQPITARPARAWPPNPFLSALTDHRRAFAARHVIGGRSFSSINREMSMAKNFALVSLSDAVRQRRGVSDKRPDGRHIAEVSA